MRENTQNSILDIFKSCKALLDGHFLLSSWLHSPQYLQCALVLQDPVVAEKLCAELAQKFKEIEIDAVVGPALGGVIVSYEVARALKARSLFVERQDKIFSLKRGFTLSPKDRVLVVEDVVTTGLSTREVIEIVQQSQAKLVGVASLVDRSGGKADFGVPFHSLLSISPETYSPDECPLCKKGKIPLIKPGSR